MSSVLYLNPHWTPDAGGELRIFDDAGQAEIATLEPFYGRLVLFLSERIPHEVLPTTRARFSLTGWFRVNNSVGGVVDPPA
ncbi:MAG: 2OG-Fe(II) oxygenase [Planctomycetota bacterium]